MPAMPTDLLADAVWMCGSSTPGQVGDPHELREAQIDWLAAVVPGTAAGALRDVGRWRWGVDDQHLLDGRDWWFRCRFASPDAAPAPAADAGPTAAPPDATRGGGADEIGRWELRLDGLATIADVWLNDDHLLHSENMFLAHRLEVERLRSDNELVIRFAALDPVLAQRHPRPRWKSRLVRSQSLRWYRTTVLGRAPGWSRWAAPVGPWRPVGLQALGGEVEVLERHVRASCEGEGGVVTVRALLRCGESPPAQPRLRVGDREAALESERAGEDVVSVHGVLDLPVVERWWPHTHGPQARYPVVLEIDGAELSLGSVGFRTVQLDRADGGFALRINDTAVFCRGACWSAPDVVSLQAAPEEIHSTVRMARDAGMNMLRVPGYTCYEDNVFWEACDQLGMLVWQDCMLVSTDPPEDPDFVSGLAHELRQQLACAEGRPALAMVCGGSETLQQPAMLGLDPERWRSALLEQTIPGLVAEILPEVPYIPSSPSGGEFPFDADAGVVHYFGVGAYMRPLTDARLANVRFATECLAFAAPPEPQTVDEAFGGALVAGHEPLWKATAARDAASSWDFEDVRDHYVRELFGRDPLDVRYSDPELALDLGRAAVAEVVGAVLDEWRRARSTCAGALVLSFRDLWPGAGWGLLDSAGRPKSSWYAFAHACAPCAVAITDEGLSGLCVHAYNDRPEPFRGRLLLTIFSASGAVVESVEEAVEIAPHDALELKARRMFAGFRDLNTVYRFGPSAYDVILVELENERGEVVGEAFHLPAGPGRPRLPDVGLEPALEQLGDGSWALSVSSRLFAQHVALDVPGFLVSDSWFHLAPGRSKTVTLSATDPQRAPSGAVRALNSMEGARVAVARDAGVST
jgi:beta-mannosidase